MQSLVAKAFPSNSRFGDATVSSFATPISQASTKGEDAKESAVPIRRIWECHDAQAMADGSRWREGADPSPSSQVTTPAGGDQQALDRRSKPSGPFSIEHTSLDSNCLKPVSA